jgi:hypothetical protein
MSDRQVPPGTPSAIAAVFAAAVIALLLACAVCASSYLLVTGGRP